MNNLIFEKDREFDLISFGRVGIDIYPNDINCPIEDVRSFSMHIGGSPANTTFGAVKLGLKTGFIGNIADDGLKKFILRAFLQNGIDVSSITLDKSGVTTQIAIAEVKSPTESTVLFYRNKTADLNIKPEDIKEAYIQKAKLLHISGTALSASPSREAVFTAIEYARKHHVRISMDIDYRPYVWKSEKEAAVYYTLAAEKCDILFGTREEFNVLEGIVDAPNCSDDVTAERLFSKLAQVVVIKHGAAGSVIYEKGGRKCRGGIFKVPVVNTMGAGDSYASAFLYGLLKGFDIEKSMCYGAGSSAMVVSKNDCTDALPSLTELEQFLSTQDLIVG